MDMRNDQFQFTSPLFIADQPSIDIASFYAACNPTGLNLNPCENTTNAAYINNVFCGPWNNNYQQPTAVDCRNGAAWVIQKGPNALNKVPQVTTNKLPVYVTNWTRQNKADTLQTDDQLVALEAMDAWFATDSPVKTVFWFGATNYYTYPDGTTIVANISNFLTATTSSGQTLGQLWNEKCMTL